MNEKEIDKPTWHFIITDWRAKRAKTETPAFLLCVNRSIMVGRIKTFGVTGRWQWARYEFDQKKDYTWFCLFFRITDSSIRFRFVLLLNGGSGYTVWCDTLVELQFVFNINRCKLIKPQTDPSTDSYIKYIKWLHKKSRPNDKKRQHSRDPKLRLFLYVKHKTHRRIKRQMVEKIYLLKMWFDRL